MSTADPRAARPALLDVKDLAVRYGAVAALKRVSLVVGEGEAVALIGCNGAGKSSTLRALSGMVRPAAGRVLYGGVDVTGVQAHALVPRGMAHAPEGRGIFLHLSVDDNLSLGAYVRKDRRAIEEDRERCFEWFPILKDRRRQTSGTLSGGEQQMLAVSRALMSRPRLLLLDEPSLGLAPQVIERIFVILREINETGVSVLLVEQNAQLALRFAHYAYVLETGDVVMEGTGEALLADDGVRKAYLGE